MKKSSAKSPTKKTGKKKSKRPQSAYKASTGSRLIAPPPLPPYDLPPPTHFATYEDYLAYRRRWWDVDYPYTRYYDPYYPRTYLPPPPPPAPLPVRGSPSRTLEPPLGGSPYKS